MGFISTFNQIMMIFLLMSVGFIANKKGFIDKTVEKSLSKMVLFFFLPAMIVNALNYEYSEELISQATKYLLISTVIYAVLIIVTKVILKATKYDQSKQSIMRYMMIFPNVGYMGYPIISLLFGNIGVFYTAFLNIPFNILVWTFGAKILGDTGKDTLGQFLKKIFLNPGIIAIAIGISKFFLQYDFPETIDRTLKLLGGCTTPISMIIIGSSLAGYNILSVFKEKDILYMSAFRLIITPLSIFIVLTLLGFSREFAMIPTIIFAMPTAVNAAIFAQLYENNPTMASKGVVFSTTLSLITIPIIVTLLNI